jgi:hypothetical protein
MSYALTPYMTSLDQMASMWDCKIRITLANSRSEMRKKLGFSMGKWVAKNTISQFNHQIKKKEGYPNFKSQNVMQDIFNGEINYPNIPWVYHYLLEGFARELSGDHTSKIMDEYYLLHPEEAWADVVKEKEEYYTRRTGLRWGSGLSKILPNSNWSPCGLSILKHLPYSVPMPLPEVGDFPYISSIRNKDLDSVLNGIDFSPYDEAAKMEMTNWFTTAKQEGRDLIIFAY